VSPAKADETMEMPFGLWAWMVPKNQVLDRVPDTRWKGAILRGEGQPIAKYRDALP